MPDCYDVHQVSLGSYEKAESLSKMPRPPSNIRPMELEKCLLCQTMLAFVMFLWWLSHNALTRCG